MADNYIPWWVASDHPARTGVAPEIALEPVAEPEPELLPVLVSEPVVEPVPLPVLLSEPVPEASPLLQAPPDASETA